MKLFSIGDQIVNLDNVVSIDVDPGNVVKRIWFVGSSTPINLEVSVNANLLLNALSVFTNFFPVGDQIVNLNNIVSLDVDPGNVIKRIWFVNSSAPIDLDPAPPVGSVVNALRSRGLL